VRTPKLDEQVCFALYSASRAVTGAYRPILDELGLTYPQYLVLLVLWERGAVSVKDLGAALRLDSGTLSPLLKRMQGNGLVRRQRRAEDERSVEITLTPRGLALRDRARSVPDRLLATLDIPHEQLGPLRDLLRRVAESAQAAPAETTTGTENRQ